MSEEVDPAELALRHLELELAWLEALLRLRLRELQAAGVLPSPAERFPGTAVSPQEVEARLRAFTLAPAERRTPAEREAGAQLTAAAEARAGFAAEHADRGLPLDVLKSRLGLDADAYLLFLLALAPELDPSFARLYAWLHNHFERQYATLSLVAEALVRGRAVRVHRLLRAQGPLVSQGIVRVGASTPSGSTMYAPLTVDPRIVRLVQGDVELDGSLEPWCAVLPARPIASMVLEGRVEPRAAALVEQFARLAERPWDLPAIVVTAPAETGKRLLAQALAHALGTHVLTIDVEALVEIEEPEPILRAALREALIRGAVACVRCGAALDPPSGLPADERPDRRPAAPPRRWLPRALRGFHGALVLTVTGVEPRELELERTVESLTWGYPDEAHATRLWDALLPARLRGEGATPPELARRFELAPGQVLSVISGAQVEQSGKKITGDVVQRQVRAQIRNRLGEAAHLVESTYTWKDLVVTDDVQVKLQELVNRHRFSHVAAREWGLARRFGGALGLSVLFAGPSGTGKTMAASIVARELGLDLYQVDLSRVVSKWLGETEKALARIFDEAERARAILLFDEADSLFSKRTSVESSHDRYANLEVNYLLQRVERFRGVAILTTNFPDSLDQAFKRRLSAQITFPAPDVAQREALWRSMLAQPGLKKEPGIRYDVLARQFELAGGLIKNAVVRAVFLALPAGVPVSEELLERAATAEMAEQGMLVRLSRR